MNKVKLPNNKSSSESFRKLRYIEGQGRGNIVLFQTQRNVDLIIFHSFSPLHIWPAIRGWWNPELSTDRCLSSSRVLTDPVTPRPPSLMESRATHMTPSKMADQPLFQLSYGGLDSVLRYQCTCSCTCRCLWYTDLLEKEPAGNADKIKWDFLLTWIPYVEERFWCNKQYTYS